jgi:hypothetical protein
MRLSKAIHLSLSALFSLSCLAVFPVVAADADPVSLENGFNAAGSSASLMKPSGDVKPVQGLRRVAITGFDVEFATQANASASATEIGRRGTASTSMYVKLVGLSQSDYQGIVDKLYSDFVKDLTAAGIEVIPVSRLMASEHFRKMMDAGGKAPYEKSMKGENLTVYSAEGRAVSGASLSAATPLGGLATFGSVATNIMSSIELQKEIDATLLSVRMVVRFGEMTSSSSSFLNRISGESSVKAKLNPMIAAGSTSIAVQSSGGGISYNLQKPLQISADAISEVKDTSSVATNVGLAVLNLAIGHGSSSSVVEKEAIADAGRYRELVGAGLGNVREMMTDRVKSLR